MRVDRGLLRRAAGIAEAAVALAAAQMALRLLPFRWLAPAVVRSGLACVEAGIPDRRAACVGASVSAAAARLPWHSTCLVRALAARLMLAGRGIPSVLYLGVAKGVNDDAEAFRAHAWLLAGGGVVCGGREAPAYTAIAAFSERLP